MAKKKKAKTGFGLNALVWREGDLFVAKALEVEAASQGKTQTEALKNLNEALELYFEDEKVPASSINYFDNLELHKVTPKVRYA